MKIEDLRLLSLEERVMLALMFYEIPELDELPPESVKAQAHAVEQWLDEHKVPTLSTGLTPEQAEALRTGVKPDPNKPRLYLNYKSVLSEADGRRLEELLNIGEFTQLGEKTNRPLSTYRLTVPDEFAAELQAIHERWLVSRICILLECPSGLFWLTPDTAHRNTNTQHYVVVPSVQTDRIHSPVEHPEKGSASWREVLEDLIARRPDLGFVQLMLHHYLQPAHVQLLHNSQLNDHMLLMTHHGTTYRVIGISMQGTLMLTTKINQGLVYDVTMPFVDIVDEAQWNFYGPDDTP